MFIYTVRARTLKFFAILAAAVAVMLTLAVIIPNYDSSKNTGADGYSFDNVKNLDGRTAFFAQFGITVDHSSEESKKVAIPNNFDAIFTRYNDIQKAQGLDLSKYKRKTLTRYTYVVTARPSGVGSGYNGRVLATILVYRGRVVGADICSAETGTGAFVSPVVPSSAILG